MKKHQILVDLDKCIGCGLCVKECPAHNIGLKNRKAHTLLSDCVFCGHCTAVCPKEAVSISGYPIDTSENRKAEPLNPHQILNVIRNRRSIRKFQDKSVPKEILHQILEAGRLTHTAKNMQDVSYIVLDKEKDKAEQLAVSLFTKLKPLMDFFMPLARQNTIHKHFFFFKAPIVIVILAKDKTNGVLAAQNMEFVAEANGLGVLFSGYFTAAANVSFKLKKALNIPKGKHAAMTLVLGYPDTAYLRPAPREDMHARYM